MGNNIQCPFCDTDIDYDQAKNDNEGVTCPECSMTFSYSPPSEKEPPPTPKVKSHGKKVKGKKKLSKAVLFGIPATLIFLIAAVAGVYFFVLNPSNKKQSSPKKEKNQNKQQNKTANTKKKAAKEEKIPQEITNFFNKIHQESNPDKSELKKKFLSEKNINPKLKATINIEKARKKVIKKIDELIKKEKAKIPDKKLDAFMAEARKKYSLARFGRPYTKKQVQNIIQTRLSNKFDEEKKKLNSGFNAERAKKKIAEHHNIQLPAKMPKQSINQVKRRAAEKVMKIIDKILRKRYQNTVQKIKNNYRSYRIGEKISVNTTTKGNLSGLYKGRRGHILEIGIHNISIRDLADYSERAWQSEYRFDKYVSQQTIKRLIHNATKQYHRDRKSKSKKIRKKAVSKYLKEAGYCKLGNEWLPAAIVMEKALEIEKEKTEKSNRKAKDKLLKKLSTEFAMKENEIFKEHGFTIQANGKHVSLFDIAKEEAVAEYNSFQQKRNKKIQALEDKIRNNDEKNLFNEMGFVKYAGKYHTLNKALNLFYKAHDYKKLKRNEMKLTDSKINEKLFTIKSSEEMEGMSRDKLFEKGIDLYNESKFDEALPFLFLAAQQYHPQALQTLAYYLADGAGKIRKNPEEAFSLFLKAAYFSEGKIIVDDLARAYRKGDYVPYSPSFAEDWQNAASVAESRKKNDNKEQKQNNSPDKKSPKPEKNDNKEQKQNNSPDKKPQKSENEEMIW